ncbi:MAG TPA: divalent metal cation transporter, partial [Bryobacteraceae bacterium]|nr:divalent metal cation transporter [Bryobacteraceae bacterium]
WLVVGTTFVILTLQCLGSYTLIRNTFRWLALALLAYIGSAALARPDWAAVLKGTLIPAIHFNREFLQLLVAVIGTSLSAYLYTWQSNMEVEEAIAHGHAGAPGRRDVTDRELRRARWDTIAGMLFASIVMYFIILSTGSTLFPAGKTEISTAAEAAQALRPLAGDAAGLLFAIGVVAVGFLAVPVMTIGAAYDLAQTFGWKNGLYAKPSEAKKFYAAIFAITLAGMSMNFFGINPIKALIWAGIVQGLLTPPLMLLIMLMTNNKAIVGGRVNSRAMNVLGWITTIATFAASIGLLITWIA